jgi:hypothetical protein
MADNNRPCGSLLRREPAWGRKLNLTELRELLLRFSVNFKANLMAFTSMWVRRGDPGPHHEGGAVIASPSLLICERLYVCGIYLFKIFVMRH